MKNNPFVSVIIPVYNGEKFLAETLDSVFAQTYRPIEVIVVDDGSTDRSAEVIHTYPEVRYFHQSNQGVGVARNVGIAAAQGEFIAFLDADDYWKPDKLSIQIPYMIEHPDFGITTTHLLNFLEPETQTPAWLQPDRDLGETDQGYIPSTLVVRKIVFEQIGNFSIDYRAGEDTEWLCRAKDGDISIGIIPKTLTFRRYHGSNLSWEMAATIASRRFRTLKESIARKTRQTR